MYLRADVLGKLEGFRQIFQDRQMFSNLEMQRYDLLDAARMQDQSTASYYQISNVGLVYRKEN